MKSALIGLESDYSSLAYVYAIAASRSATECMASSLRKRKLFQNKPYCSFGVGTSRNPAEFKPQNLHFDFPKRDCQGGAKLKNRVILVRHNVDLYHAGSFIHA